VSEARSHTLRPRGPYLRLALLALFLPAPARAELSRTSTVVSVLGPVAPASALSGAEADAIAEHVQALLLEVPGFTVIPRDATRAKVVEAKAQTYAPGVDADMQVEVGSEVAPQKVLNLVVASLGAECVAKAELVELRTSAAVWGRSRRVRCRAGAITAAYEDFVDALRLGQTGQGKLVVTSAPAGAVVALDGRDLGKTPLALDLPPRTGRLSLALDGYEFCAEGVDVRAGEVTRVERTLRPNAAARLGVQVEKYLPWLLPGLALLLLASGLRHLAQRWSRETSHWGTLFLLATYLGVAAAAASWLFDLDALLPWRAPAGPVGDAARYTRERCGGVVDARTGHAWFVGEDRDLTWAEASAWIAGLRACDRTWRMPTLAELAALHDPSARASAGHYERGRHWPPHLDVAFAGIGGGSWVWAIDPAAGARATSFNFNIGKPVSYDRSSTRYSTRAFAVADLAEGSARAESGGLAAASREEVTAFARRYFELLSAEELEPLLAMYGQRVDYHDRGFVDVSVIRADRRASSRRWAVATYALVGEVRVEPPQGAFVRATADVSFSASTSARGGRTTHGRARHHWVLERGRAGLRIVAEDREVLEREGE
jgi:hypothetical protein